MKLVDYKSDSEDDNWSESAPEFFEEEVESVRLSRGCGHKRKIMSAELALQRELAYVMKVTRLQFQHQKVEENPPEFIQVPSSIKSVRVDLAKAQIENPSRESPKQRRQFYTEQNLQIHPSGSVPCFPPLQLEQTYADQSPGTCACSSPPLMQYAYTKQTPELQQECLFCRECMVPCASAFDLEQHHRGKNHIVKPEELKLQKDGENTRARPLWCDLCKVPCMNEHCFREHLKGKKHAARRSNQMVQRSVKEQCVGASVFGTKAQ